MIVLRYVKCTQPTQVSAFLVLHLDFARNKEKALGFRIKILMLSWQP